MSLEKTGLDFAHKDESVRVQDDLYRHFNGQWLKTAVIPADRATDGAFIKLRIQSEARRIATDPHSPAEFRCNQIVKSFTPFYEVLGVTEKDALWLDEQSRVQIW